MRPNVADGSRYAKVQILALRAKCEYEGGRGRGTMKIGLFHGCFYTESAPGTREHILGVYTNIPVYRYIDIIITR